MIKKTFLIMTLALCLWGISGSAVLAFDPLVTCGRQDVKGVHFNNDAELAKDCNFSKAIDMINTLIKFAIYISMPLAAIAFAYAGYLYLSAGGDTAKVTQANKIFTSVGIGLVIVLSGWLVFTFIQKTFLSVYYQDQSYLN